MEKIVFIDMGTGRREFIGGQEDVDRVCPEVLDDREEFESGKSRLDYVTADGEYFSEELSDEDLGIRIAENTIDYVRNPNGDGTKFIPDPNSEHNRKYFPRLIG